MFGVFLTSISSLFEEIFASIAKYKHAHREVGVYSIVFLSLLGSEIFYFILLVINKSLFHFSSASLLTLIPRMVLEVLQEYISVAAIMKADRSVFSFIRIGTIPLLLLVDVFLGYTITLTQITGIGIILLTLFFLSAHRTLNLKGKGIAFLSSIIPVATISLYKYDITYYNSVVAEQIIVSTFLILLFFIGAIVIAKENPIFFLKKPVFLTQTVIMGVAGVIGSVAYVFAPASVITTAKRSSAMVWAITSGKFNFGETHVVVKIISMLLLAGGTILLVI